MTSTGMARMRRVFSHSGSGTLVMAALLAGSTASPAAAAGGSLPEANGLITAEEAMTSARAFAEHPEGPPLVVDKAMDLNRANALAPRIEVLEPRLGAITTPPFDVRVIAHPREGLAIDRSSIRVRYGFFRIDVTQRMLSLGRWEGNEFIVSRAQAPAGTHWFYVTVADSAHQAANVDVKVVIR